jgi:hypothetical protein
MKPKPDLSSRITLRIGEAADALGVSESHLRRALPSLDGCVLHLGDRVLFSVAGLQKWVEAQVRAEDQGARAEAKAILRGLE